MRRLGFLLPLSLLLFAGAPAHAKEVTAAQLCGASGCVDVDDRATLAALQEGGPPTDPPAEGSAWYRAQLTVDTGDGHHETFPMVVVPSERLMRGGDAEAGYTWMSISGDAAKTIAAAAHPAAPFPAEKLAGTSPVPRRNVIGDEVTHPPNEPATGGTPWGWIAGGVAAALAAAALLLRRFGRPSLPQAFGWRRRARGSAKRMAS